MASRPGTPSLGRFLDRAPELAALSAHAQRLMELQRIFVAVVPGYLADSSRVANWRLGLLVLHANNAAVATKLKQLANTLRTAFLRQGMDVNEIQVKVQPLRQAKVIHQPGPVPKIAAPVKDSLSALSQTLPPDSPLKLALIRFLTRSA